MFWFWCDVRFLSGRGEEQGWIIRLVSLDTLQCMEMSSPIYLRRRHFSYRGRKVGVVYDFRRRWEVFQISQEGGMGSWFQEKVGWVLNFRRRWDGILISGESGIGSLNSYIRHTSNLHVLFCTFIKDQLKNQIKVYLKNSFFNFL